MPSSIRKTKTKLKIKNLWFSKLNTYTGKVKLSNDSFGRAVEYILLKLTCTSQLQGIQLKTTPRHLGFTVYGFNIICIRCYLI